MDQAGIRKFTVEMTPGKTILFWALTGLSWPLLLLGGIGLAILGVGVIFGDIKDADMTRSILGLCLAAALVGIGVGLQGLAKLVLAKAATELTITEHFVRQMEKNAETAKDWRECAEAWEGNLQNEAEAARCIRSMESWAEKSGHWRECARAWKEIFDDDGAARRCLDHAEGISGEDYLAWTMCAVSWRQLLGDMSRARRCDQKAREFKTHA